MKLALLSLGCLVSAAMATPTNTVAERSAAHRSWAGTSNYFLQGMSGSDQKSYLSTLSDAGVKVIRLWVNSQPGGGACVKGSRSVSSVPDFEEQIGNYKWETLDLLDQTLVYLQQYGLKAIISPHDANVLGGANGNDIYGRTWGSGYFYEKQDAINAYDNRLSAILNYHGKHSGQVWKNWDDVVLAFDIQNEPFNAKTEECFYSSAENWPCGRAQHMRSVMGGMNPIKIASGGLGGDIVHDCTFIGPAVNCGQIDIISVHRYAGGEDNNQGQWAGSYNNWLDKANGKLVHLEEWGVNTDTYNPSSEFPKNTNDMNSVGLPWTYWMLLPPKVCEAHDTDPFPFFVDQGVSWRQEVQEANNAYCPQDWSAIVP